jgi:hypothetical protein
VYRTLLHKLSSNDGDNPGSPILAAAIYFWEMAAGRALVTARGRSRRPPSGEAQRPRGSSVVDNRRDCPGRYQASRSSWADIEGVGSATRRERLAYAGSDESVVIAEAGAQRRGVNTRMCVAPNVKPTSEPRTTGSGGVPPAPPGGADQTSAPPQALGQEHLNVGWPLYRLDRSRRVANVSRARRSFAACETPDSDSSSSTRTPSEALLAHHARGPLTNLLKEISVESVG